MAATATRALADTALELVLAGTPIVAALGGLLMVAVSQDRTRRILAAATRILRRPSSLIWAAGLSILSLALSALAALVIHRRLPRLVDSMVQLLHARGFEAGLPLLPLPDPAAARLVQNSVALPEGWASIYPPGHTLVLAAGLRASLPWLVGPVLTALSVGATAAVLDRLLENRMEVARAASLSVALSPFLLLLGSTHLSHSSALAGLAVTLWAALRARSGHAAWGLIAGVAVALAVASRPWIGLVAGTYLILAAWSWDDGGSTPRTSTWWIRRSAMVGLGGLPCAVAFLAYHLRVFGSPWALGYSVAFGPDHGLGFHRDPWGNLYGLREALGYTAADLSTLGLRLFETPIPAVALVGAFLLRVPRTAGSTNLLLGWAVVPVLANTLYWHHGQLLGPRMLLEAAPAWAALTILAGVGLVLGRDPGISEDRRVDWTSSRISRWTLWTLLSAVPFGAAVLLPGRLAEARMPEESVRLSTPPPSTDPQALVFVHGSWAGRIGARLAGTGMRRDSIETALRRNGLCRVHRYAEAREAGDPLPDLDLEPRPGYPRGLVRVETSSGIVVRLEPGSIPGTCLREIRADRYGTVELAPLLWQTALPGETGPLIVRDLGPAANARTLATYPERHPVYWGPAREGGPPELLPYAEAMRRIWESTDQTADAVDPTARPAPR